MKGSARLKEGRKALHGALALGLVVLGPASAFLMDCVGRAPPTPTELRCWPSSGLGRGLSCCALPCGWAAPGAKSTVCGHQLKGIAAKTAANKTSKAMYNGMTAVGQFGSEVADSPSQTIFWGGASGHGKLAKPAHQKALEKSLGIKGQSCPMVRLSHEAMRERRTIPARQHVGCAMHQSRILLIPRSGFHSRTGGGKTKIICFTFVSRQRHALIQVVRHSQHHSSRPSVPQASITVAPGLRLAVQGTLWGAWRSPATVATGGIAPSGSGSHGVMRSKSLLSADLHVCPLQIKMRSAPSTQHKLPPTSHAPVT